MGSFTKLKSPIMDWASILDFDSHACPEGEDESAIVVITQRVDIPASSNHSVRSASTGSSAAARRAGNTPAIKPMTTAMISAIIT